MTNLEKDTIQLKKAEIKVGAITGLLPSLINLNNELSDEERKPYTIMLDYVEFEDYYRFSIDIMRTNHYKPDSLIDLHFSLKNLEDGLQLFDEVRNCFVDNSHLIYTGFQTHCNQSITSSFNAVGANRIDLVYKIHSDEELQRLTEYNNSLSDKANILVKRRPTIIVKPE